MLKRLRETPSSSSSSSSAASGEERNHNCCVSRLTLEAWPPPPPFLPPVPPAKDRNGGSVAGSGKSQEWDTRLLTHGLKLPSKSKNGVLLQNSINNKDICIMPSERIPSHRSSYEMPAKKAKKEADFCHADLATRKAQNSKLCFPQPGRKDIDEEEEDEEDGKEAEAVDGRILSSLVLVDVDLDGQTVRSKGKDRHSKVRTAKGLRDRRVRLSAPTAIQFFDVQDRLGFDQPSKAVDWLLRNAKAAIEELQQLKEARRESTQEINKSKEEEKEETKNVSASSSPLSARISTPGPALKAEKESALESPASSSSLKRSSGPKNSSPVHDKNRAGLRAKARERARERANLMKGKDSFLLIPAANEGIKEGDSRDDNDHCSNLNKPNQAEQERVGSPQEQQQQQSHCAYTFPQSHQQSGNERSASNSTPVAPSELSHHLLLLKQQQALQASLLSYLLSNVPRDTANTAQRQFPTMHPAAASTTEAENASRLHAPSSSSSSSQQQPPWQEQVMYEDRPGFRQSNLNLYCQGGAGAPQQPLSTTNSTHASAYSKSREDRAAAALVYSHLLLGHYQLDSQISSQQAYQAPAALRPPSPSTTMNESMNRHGFYNHHNPHHYHHYQQQLPPPQPPLPTQAAWANQNYQQSSTGGTLQSIFSPTSNSLLLLSATSEHTTTPPSSSTASANLLNINIASRSIPAWSIPDHHDGPSPPTSSWSHH